MATQHLVGRSRVRALVSAAFTAGVIVSVTFPLAEMAGYAVVYGGEELLLPIRQLAAIILGEEALNDDFSVLAVIPYPRCRDERRAQRGVLWHLRHVARRRAITGSVAAAPPDHG